MFSLIQRNANRLQRLVESILDFSKIESGQFHGRFTPTRLGTFTLSVAEVFRSSVEKAKITYTIETLGDDERLVYVDTASWEKVVFNLLGELQVSGPHQGFDADQCVRLPSPKATLSSTL